MPSSATSTSQLCTLSLHDALPIFRPRRLRLRSRGPQPKTWRRVTMAPPPMKRWATRGFVFSAPPLRPRRLCGESFFGTSGGEFTARSEEHTSELQSLAYLVCRLLLRRPPSSALFPYTTLFRSFVRGGCGFGRAARSRKLGGE